MNAPPELKVLDCESTLEERARLATELKAVRAALKDMKTTVQFTELKSARSRRQIALPAVVVWGRFLTGWCVS